MSVLWDRGSATVSEVVGDINKLWEPEIAHNTALTYLTILKRRGWASVKRDGIALRFYPKVSLAQTRFYQLERVTDLLFGGSRTDLLTYLVLDKLTPRASLEAVVNAATRRLKEPPRAASRPG